MLRQIITIDEEKCDGCALCVTACHEGAIGMVDGKAKLLREDFCDGLGDCLPSCPQNAISFEKRETVAFDEDAVERHKAASQHTGVLSGCPGAAARSIGKEEISLPLSACPGSAAQSFNQENRVASVQPEYKPISELRQWPIQIKLVPPRAPYFDNAHLLVAADCTAFAYGDFHAQYMRNKITLIGCPKLDEGDYSEKLTEIVSNNNIKSITVARMSVPCCGGIENAVKNALRNSRKMIPWQIVTISSDGHILE